MYVFHYILQAVIVFFKQYWPHIVSCILLKQKHNIFLTAAWYCCFDVYRINRNECPTLINIPCLFYKDNYVPPPKVRGGHISFSADPGCRCRRRQFGIHHISWISWWNFTRLAWIHHWDKPKSWLSFGDSDPIFKVTGGLRLLNFLRRHRHDRFLYPRYLLNQ